MALPDLLRVFSQFRRTEQPEWFAHVYPHGHATARLARCFAAHCRGVTRTLSLDEIEFGAHVHDIGKYLISKSILLKRGELNEDERTIMSLHPIYAAQILHDLPYVTPQINNIALYHHERWDGGGYPEGLSGNAIPLGSRIVAVADVYTALRARRTYKPTLTRAQACATLTGMAGRELDPSLVLDFLRFVGIEAKTKCA